MEVRRGHCAAVVVDALLGAGLGKPQPFLIITKIKAAMTSNTARILPAQQ